MYYPTVYSANEAEEHDIISDSNSIENDETTQALSGEVDTWEVFMTN